MAEKNRRAPHWENRFIWQRGEVNTHQGIWCEITKYPFEGRRGGRRYSRFAHLSQNIVYHESSRVGGGTLFSHRSGGPSRHTWLTKISPAHDRKRTLAWRLHCLHSLLLSGVISLSTVTTGGEGRGGEGDILMIVHAIVCYQEYLTNDLRIRTMPGRHLTMYPVFADSGLCFTTMMPAARSLPWRCLRQKQFAIGSLGSQYANTLHCTLRGRDYSPQVKHDLRAHAYLAPRHTQGAQRDVCDTRGAQFNYVILTEYRHT